MSDISPAADAVFLSHQVGATPEDPLVVLERWLITAKREIGFPATAMSLATATTDADPDVRIVVLQALDEGGLVFFTNLTSSKGSQLLANFKAAACFHWPAIGKQVRVRGSVHRVDDHYADHYFASRPRGSQIGAHASPQSTSIEDRAALIRLVNDADARFSGKPIPRPAHWTGLVLVPAEIEFWEDGADRLHDRMLFRRSRESGAWGKTRLAP